MRERGREKKEKKIPNFYLQSTEFCRLEFVGPRTKVHLLSKIQAISGFAEDSSEEFRKSKVSGLESVHGTS